MNVTAENLMLVIDPVSEQSCSAAQLWLKRQAEASFSVENDHQRGMNAGLTTSEMNFLKAQTTMVRMSLTIGDQVPKSELDPNAVKNFNEDLSEALEMQLSNLSKIKDDALAVKDTLHPLYVSYELGTTVMKFFSYLSRIRQDAYNTKEEGSIKIRDMAQALLRAVVEKSSSIKKALDESGWIDSVLRSVSGGEQPSGNQSQSIANMLTSMIDENFMEEWAGHVLESWRDSVVGFSYFKARKV